MAFTPKPKPRGDNETDAAYNKRVANWTKSQERLKSVGITGGVNNANKAQLDKFTKKYGHGPAGLKPVQGPTADAPPPTMDATNPSAPKPGSSDGKPDKGKQNAGASASGHSVSNAMGFGPYSNNALGGSTAAGSAARQGLSRMASRTGRRARRAARQSMRRGY
jgi:hypothetical protein